MSLLKKKMIDDNVEKIFSVYIRVSTERQAVDGDSIEMQENLGRKIIEENNGVLYKIYIEPAVSASKTKLKDRQVLQECLADARNGLFNHLIVYRRDRLARKTEDSLAIRSILEDAKCELIFSATGEMQAMLNDPYGKLMENIRSSLDEIESAQISMRVSDVMRDKAKRGEDSGGNLPYGYIRKDGKIIQVEEEIKVIEEIEDLYLAGYGIHTIARWLNGENIKSFGTRPGGRVYKRKQHARSSEYWTKDVINTILFNSFYIGILEYSPEGEKRLNKDKSTYIRSKSQIHEACRTEEKHNRILRLKNIKQDKRVAPRRYSTPFLLTGLLFCKCGEKYISRSVTKSNGDQYHYYTCNSRHSHVGKTPCNNHVYKKEIIEDYVIQKIKNKLDSVNISSIKKEICQQLENGSGNLSDSLTTLEKKIQRFTKDYASIRRLLLDLDPDDINYDLLKEGYQSDQAELLKKLNDSKTEKARIEREISQYSHVQENQLAAVDKLISFKDTFLQSDFHSKKLLLDEIVEKIVIFEDGKVEADFYIPFVDTVKSIVNEVENIDVSVIGNGGVGDTTTLKNITVHLPLHSKIQDNLFEWINSIYSVTKDKLNPWIIKMANVKNATLFHTKTNINYRMSCYYFNNTYTPSRKNWYKISSNLNLKLENFINDMNLNVNPDVFFSIIEFAQLYGKKVTVS